MPAIPPAICRAAWLPVILATRRDNAAIGHTVCYPAVGGSIVGYQLNDARIGYTLCSAALDAAVLDISVFIPIKPTVGVAGVLMEFDPLIEKELDSDLTVEFLIGGSTIARMTSDNPFLTLSAVALQIYAMWGYQLRQVSDINIGLTAITAWCNTAMQMIYARAGQLEYFNRETVDLTITSSGELALESRIQKLLGHVRLKNTKKTLRPLQSQGELDQFMVRYMDDTSSPPSSPLAYFLDSRRADTPDSVALKLVLVPPPTADLLVQIDCTTEPPRYSEQDFRSSTPLQLPHKWAETIFVPLVKKWALGDSLMPGSSRATLQPEIDQQYQSALAVLGMADPSEPAKTKSQPGEAATP